jgi:CrcB protein
MALKLEVSGSLAQPESAWKRRLTIHLMLAIFGIAGALARIGLDRLTSFPGSQYGGVLWSNFTGTLIMGMLVGCETFCGLVGTHSHLTKAQIPLYIGLTTGLCGSITSFSSFMISLFEFSANQPPGSVDYPNPGYGVMVFLSYLFVTLCVSFGGFYVGGHLSGVLDRVSFKKIEESLVVTLSVLTVSGYIVILVTCIVISRGRYWSFSCLFAPFGVYFRYWISKLLNPLSHRFMFGTFLVNMLATILISFLVIFQRGENSSKLLVPGLIHCQLVTALQDGFCGNFSTVSTFIAELNSYIRHRDAYLYGGISIGCGFSLVVVILGTYTWTKGLSNVTAC